LTVVDEPRIIKHKTIVMNTTGNQPGSQNQQGGKQTQRPEIRDNLDSRKNEEQDMKGDDTTHNEKDTRNNKQKKKK
jgi:hypothetical protein